MRQRDSYPALGANLRVLIPAATAGAFLFLYREIITRLVHDWISDGNYSHGLLVAPVALFVMWQRRRALAEAPAQPQLWGLALVGTSLALLIFGALGAEFFTARLSMLGVIAGAIWFIWGTAHLRIAAFPLALMLLTIPLPEIVFNQVTLPLQSLAARAGETSLAVLNVPVLREGNVIVLATGSLEVAEACSGIRSLMSLVALAVIYGYMIDARIGMRTLLAFAAVPIAVVANGVRVAGTGLAASRFGAEAAEGFFHTFSGWLMFVLAFGLLVATHKIATRVASIFAGASTRRGAEAAHEPERGASCSAA
jgi:exosortase